MDIKDLLISLNFSPKENTVGVFSKKYPQADNYCLEIDFEKQLINYGEKIISDSKTTLNFVHDENWVVLECVNRLLEKGYQPENIVLEKTYPAGHGTSGRLDICVTRNDGSEYLLIECKTYGKEFDKAFARMKKDGGQLFTYFKFSNKADVIMLYASELKGKEIVYRNEIVKIEDDYRTGDVKDFYEKWNKLTKDNGVFDSWVNPYNFQSKAITKEQLKAIRAEDSSFIFNRFLEILRHNVVSDKGNAFNKIFTLFLCKVYDETSTLDGEELQFQWKEGIDNHVSFQLRLTDLYGKGMQKFLERTVSDFNEDDFNKRCDNLKEETKKFLLQEVNKLRLEKNNEFALKEVYDAQSFEENAKVVKEVVELIQGYRIRYNKRQQYLSDFFELLLTTGLKQEAGQFFTPVPIAQFIIKSLPLDTIVFEKLKQKDGEILPYMIDYAAGSGHFITEYMHEVQRLINRSNPKNHIDSTAKKIKNWQDDHFDWATQYVYGVEKDYRLVKVGKVGCYLHGDGLANVILSDGLANFSKCKDYKVKLKKDAKDTSKDNQQFDILLSNPPYSVAAFRQTTRDYYTENDFELYANLTENSSEIECLFIERTKQLLRDGGVAGVILPSSMLSNEGIYTKAREIILKYFEIIAITELGSNTFMATGTNTVVLFLRRRNNYDCLNFAARLENSLKTCQDNTINGIEKPIVKYINHVWESIGFEDYVSLLKKEPNSAITHHEIYKEYQKKIKAKTIQDFWSTLIETEKEKLLYFILAYSQKVVLVKTGEKDAEKRFLGYEFSNRRGSEGIHPIQRGKTIDECTRLFDDHTFENPEKASTYIYKAFSGDYDFPIHESLKDNISRVHLVDMLTLDRAIFPKNVSTAVKKKVRIESKWDIYELGDVVENLDSQRIPLSKRAREKGEIPYYGATGIIDYVSDFIFNEPLVLIGEDGAKWGANENSAFLIDGKSWVNNHAHVLKPKRDKILDKFLIALLNKLDLSEYITGMNVPKLNQANLNRIQIPLPPKEIQEKIVSEIEVLEKKEAEAKEKNENLKNVIFAIIEEKAKGVKTKLQDVTVKIGSGATPLGGEGVYKSEGITFIRSQNVYDGYFVENGLAYIDEEQAKKLEGVTVEKNDILFNITGASIARCCVVEEKYLPARVNQHVSIIRTNEKALPKYVQQILVSKEYKDKLLQIGDGATSRQAITKSQLENFSIPLPPLPEQQKIVSEIEKIEAQIADIQLIINRSPALKNEVLKKYL